MKEIANIERRKKIINIEQKKEIDETHYSSLKTVCRPIKKRGMRETGDARAYGFEKLINEQHELGTEK